MSPVHLAAVATCHHLTVSPYNHPPEYRRNQSAAAYIHPPAEEQQAAQLRKRRPSHSPFPKAAPWQFGI